jgi:tRNA-specific 2-thiouridylase
MDMSDIQTRFSGVEFPGKHTVEEAGEMAETLGIEHYHEKVGEPFKRYVIDNFFDEYRCGRTPNPCVRCNRYIKFGYVLDRARQLGFDALATGHYARVVNGKIFRGKDIYKDQSYFLYPLYEKKLERIIMPLGEHTKNDIRRMAAEYGLAVAAKKESQDICFISGGRYSELLEAHLSFPSGPIVDEKGTRLGVHGGIHHYTIGQRKGLGALGGRMYVKEIIPQTNTIVVCEKESLSVRSIAVKDIVFGDGLIVEGQRYMVQVRYKSKPVEATVKNVRDRTMTVVFRSAVKGVAPGQSAVVYDRSMLAGGGVIASTD